MPITKKRRDSHVSRTSGNIVVSERIIELKRKIMDAGYIDNAVDRIATVVSKKIAEHPSLSERTAGRVM